MKRLQILAEELCENFDGRNLVARALTAPLPVGIGARSRTQMLRWCGFDIGRTTTIAGPFTVTGGRSASNNLHIGERCFINVRCVFDASTDIHIGDDVALGQDVLVTTSSHHVSHPEHRAGELLLEPVHVERGAWIAARVVLLPGVTVGSGSIITAGAVVNRSIPPHTMAGGVPARVIKQLP